MRNFRKYIIIIMGLMLIPIAGEFRLLDCFFSKKSNLNVGIESFPSLSGDSKLLAIALSTITTGARDMMEANTRIFAREHVDKLGSIDHSAQLNSLKAKAVTSNEQFHSSKIKASEFHKGFSKDITPISYRNYHQLGSGIVFIQLPGTWPPNDFRTNSTMK